MSRHEKLVRYIRETVDEEFEADQELAQLLDSVSLLQLIMYIDQEMEITLDLASLSIEMFASVDTLVAHLGTIRAE